MGLSAVGREATTSILGGAMEMWSQGSTITAAAVAFCAVIAPGTFIAFMLVVLLAALRPPAPRWVGQMLRIATFVEPWSMSEVMLLGILVALIKIAQLATVIPGIGMYAVGLARRAARRDRIDFRSARDLDACRLGRRHDPDAGSRDAHSRERDAMTAAALGAAHSGLASCTTCGLLSRPADHGQPEHCPRCGATLSARHHFSIQTTWALVIAAAILYIPANALPVLTTTTLGSSESDTIISGVVYLYQSGSWPLALIVLIASVMIPLGKLVALGYLLITVQRGSAQQQS